jgi:hypothetical protein
LEVAVDDEDQIVEPLAHGHRNGAHRLGLIGLAVAQEAPDLAILRGLGDGNFAVYSGDVNQDGTINIVDFNSISNSCMNFESGYVSRDLTGDGLTESADESLVENNQQVSRSKP